MINMQGFSLLDVMSKSYKKGMSEMESAGIGIVEMSYNCLFHGVIHDGIGSYAHFHDALFGKITANALQ